MAELASYLLGPYGTRLLVIALVVAGVRVALPRTTWAWLPGAGPDCVRLLARVAASIARLLARLKVRSAAGTPPTQPIARFFEPGKLADLQGGLRYLGYSRLEIQSVTKRLDPSAATEKLLRDALRLLQRAA